MSQLCRLCLRPSSGRHVLFKAKIGDSDLEEVLRDTFHLKLAKSPSLPTNVCDCCLRKVECLHQFHKEIVRSQLFLEEGKKVEVGGKVEEQHQSDALYEQIEMLVENEQQELLEEEHLEEQPPLLPVESVQFESVDFEVEDESADEQLVDIKIEALVEENEEDGADRSMLVEDDVSVEGLEDEDSQEAVESMPNEPMKLKRTYKTKRRKDLVVMETIPNKCYVCNEVLEDKDSFEIHLVNHTNMLPHDCLQCSTETNPIHIKTLLALNKHYESHGFNFVCDHCPLRFRSYPPLYDHTRNAHASKDTEFSCETCGQKFIEIRKYRKHILAHKNQELQKYKCETCEKTFQTGTLLRRHEKTHSNEVLFVCPFCGRGFNHESNYTKHKLRHIKQQQLELNGHPCKICDNFFTTAADLRKHMVEHYPDDPVYQAAAEKVDYFPPHMKDTSTYPRHCEEPNCTYFAPTYALMWSHYRNHYKSYTCKECDRKFATATILKNHVEIIHRKIRKYQCEYCEKTFAYQHKYKEHIHVHLGLKQRNCRYCNKSFTHSSNLIVHERIHTQTKNYACEICGSRYITTSALKKHQRTHGVGGAAKAGATKPEPTEDADGVVIEEEEQEEGEEEGELPVYLVDDEAGMQDGIVGEMEVEHKELIATLEGE